MLKHFLIFKPVFWSTAFLCVCPRLSKTTINLNYCRILNQQCLANQNQEFKRAAVLINFNSGSQTARDCVHDHKLRIDTKTLHGSTGSLEVSLVGQEKVSIAALSQHMFKKSLIRPWIEQYAPCSNI